MTLNPAALQTATDHVVFSTFASLRAPRKWEENGAEGVPFYDGLATEPVVLSDGMICDAFALPVVATADFYPTTMSPGFNANSVAPLVHEGRIYTDAVKVEYPVFIDTEITNYVLSIVPLVYVQIPVLAAQLTSRGFGFRKFYPTRLVDADTDGPFGLDLNGVAEGSYVEMNLGSEVCLTRMSLWMSGAGSAAKFEIQGSNGGGTWTDLLGSLNYFEPTLAGVNTKTFTNETSYSRYRLVLADGGGVHTVKVYEMALYSIPQEVVASSDVPPVSAEATSLKFRNNQYVDWTVDDYLEATYTFVAPLTLAAYNMMYVWVKVNKIVPDMAGLLTITSTDLSEVAVQVAPTAADTWTRIPINLNTLVLADGVNDVVSFKFTPSTVQGLEVIFGAMTVGETLVLGTRGFDADQYITIHSDVSSAYLFFTTSVMDPESVTDFGVTATPQPAGPLTPPEFSGSFDKVLAVGTLYDTVGAAHVRVYAAKFDLAQELNGPYYFTFFAPTIADLNIVGWAVAREA